MRARVNGAWEDVDSGLVRVGNAWKRLASIRVYVGGAWREGKTFTLPLSLTASPPSEFVAIVGGGTATSVEVTATPSGGLAPFTYSWARTSGTGGVALNPTSATTRFRRTMATDEVAENQFTCTVTDALGSPATAVVSVTFVSTPSDFS